MGLLTRASRLSRALAALALTACASTDLPPVDAPGSGYAHSEEERKLIVRSQEFDTDLRQKGYVLEDARLQAYLDGVARPLVPAGLPEGLAFRFHVLREPMINAFALANGSVYLHAGLFAHTESEAQLAQVLAHEITHTVKRHQLRGLLDFQNKTVAAKIVQMTVGTAGSAVGFDLMTMLVGLSHAAAVSGYSRELEREADLLGLERVAASGYATEGIPRVFELYNEVEEPGAVDRFFYSDHPSNAARAAYMRELIEQGRVPRNPAGRTGATEYREAVRGAVVENIRLRLRARHYAFALQEVETALERYGEGPELHYLAGEAHREAAADPEGAAREEAMRRRETPDRERIAVFETRAPAERQAAMTEYRRALELDPTFARAHRGLGLVAHAAGDTEATRSHLERYLSLAPRVSDRRFIERVLAEAGQ